MQTETAPAAAPKLDNLFGVCHALGQAFGFNPLWLRILFTVGILANFEVAVSLYAILGIAVLAGALVSRKAKRAEA